jgi:hypothetical protein
MIFIHLKSIIGTVKITIIKINISLTHMGPSSLNRTLGHVAPTSTSIVTVIVEIKLLIQVLLLEIFLSMNPLLAKTTKLPIWLFC